jgi:hypothetical protein
MLGEFQDKKSENKHNRLKINLMIHYHTTITNVLCVMFIALY